MEMAHLITTALKSGRIELSLRFQTKEKGFIGGISEMAMRFVRLVSSLRFSMFKRCEKIKRYLNAGAKGLPSSYTRKEFERSSSVSTVGLKKGEIFPKQKNRSIPRIHRYKSLS